MRCLILLLVVLTVVLPAAAQETRRRNVVVFVADDLGALDPGYAGSRFNQSPHLDALAQRGCVFTNAYAAAPVCSPTRAALMTGRYPARTGVTDYIGGPQPAVAATQPKYRDRLLPAPYKTQLALEHTTVAEAMKQAGYATFFAGKWHLGHQPYYPDKQGFDVTVGASHRGHPGAGGYFSPYQVPLSPGPEGEHLDLRLADEAARWIGQQTPDKPFLLWMSFYDVHTPLEAPAEAIEHFKQKKQTLGLSDDFATEGASKLRLNQSHPVYAAMVKTMDDAVGVILKQLESQDLLDDTIIIFTSDNGGVSTAEGWPTSNLPLRAGKGWAYEGGLRVPLIVAGPGVARAGSSSDVPAISNDIFPTLLDLCGVAARPQDHVDGISLAPALRGQSPPNRPLLWHYPHYGNQGGSPFSAVRAGEWKLIAFHDPQRDVELYNLAAHPGEKTNLASREPEKLQELRALLERWKQEVGAVDASSAKPTSP